MPNVNDKSSHETCDAIEAVSEKSIAYWNAIEQLNLCCNIAEKEGDQDIVLSATLMATRLHSRLCKPKTQEQWADGQQTPGVTRK